jgi:hypothetical protein
MGDVLEEGGGRRFRVEGDQGALRGNSIGDVGVVRDISQIVERLFEILPGDGMELVKNDGGLFF